MANEKQTVNELEALQKQVLLKQLEDLEQAKRLREYELKEKAKKEAEEAIQKEQEAAFQKSNALAQKAAQIQKTLEQESCNHRQEITGKTHLCGQRDHFGVTHLICQSCHKTFKGTEIPPSLMPDPNSIGGPDNITPIRQKDVVSAYLEKAALKGA
jgi:rubrerythrin